MPKPVYVQTDTLADLIALAGVQTDFITEVRLTPHLLTVKHREQGSLDARSNTVSVRVDVGARPTD